MEEKKKKISKNNKKEKIIFVNNPKFDATVLKILVERQEMFKELAKWKKFLIKTK